MNAFLTSVFTTDVSRQHCPCLPFVRIFRKFVSGFRPDFLPGICLSGFCLSRFCDIISVCCPGFVRILEKKDIWCLSVRLDKDEAELSGLSLSLSADVCHTIELFLADDVEYVQCDLYHIKCEHCLSVIPSYAL